MPKELVISAAPHETRVAILEDGQLCEIYIEREKEFALVGSIYKGRVTRVLPGMQSAFVDIGLDSDAFLYVGDFLENLEDYDHVVTAVEGKVEKMEQQGGVIFAPAPTAAATSAEGASTEEPVAESWLGSGSQAESTDAVPESAPQPQHNEPGASHSAGPAVSHVGTPAPAIPPPATSPTPASPFIRQDRPSGPPSHYRDNRQDYRQGPPPGQGPREGQGRDQGRDRGGRQRGGRFRRGRGPDRRPGRDLPPSKYASSRPFAPSRPYEPPGPEEPAGDYSPVILPGESLAKYKDRIPGAAPVTPPATDRLTDAAKQSVVPELPASLYASPQESSQEMGKPSQPPPSSLAEPEALLADVDPVELESEAGLIEPDTRLHETQQTLSRDTLPATFSVSAEHHEHEGLAAGAASAADLSDDEVTALAEQLAEARQEEASADAAVESEHVGPEEAEEDDADMAAARSLAESRSTELPADTESTEAGLDEAEDEADEPLDEDGAEDAAEDSHEAEQQAGAETFGEAASPSEGTPEDLSPDPSTAESGTESFPGENAVLSAPPQQRPLSARISDPQRARFQRPMRRGGRQRGNRPMRHQDHRLQAARRPQLISEMLKAGQEIIVQIAKEPLGKKGARITSHVALPGRFLVYMPTVNHIGVSRRIGSAEERSRLRHLVTEAKGTFPGGFIVRTAAEGAPEDEIRSDVEFLGRTWDKIRNQAEPRKSPALLHRDLNLVERILRDYVSNDYTAVWIDNEEEFSKVVDFVSRFQPKLVNRVKLYTKPTPIFEEFGIQQELDKALRPKVWLKSGGYIVINHTEALVAIDVNTGKYVGRGSTRLEDTIVKTNLEAVKEIIRQIRLRDLGGIIVLDFIDMEERRNREKVMAALDAALRADRAPSKALPFNEFGLVCVTRKRTKQALERVLCQPCPYCSASGMVKSVPTICYEIQAEARKMSADLDASSLTLRVHPEIAKALKTREAMLIEELEQATRKSIIIQADPTLHWEQYDIY